MRPDLFYRCCTIFIYILRHRISYIIKCGKPPTRNMLLNIILHYINSKKYDINDISLASG